MAVVKGICLPDCGIYAYIRLGDIGKQEDVAVVCSLSEQDINLILPFASSRLPASSCLFLPRGSRLTGTGSLGETDCRPSPLCRQSQTLVLPPEILTNVMCSGKSKQLGRARANYKYSVSASKVVDKEIHPHLFLPQDNIVHLQLAQPSSYIHSNFFEPRMFALVQNFKFKF